VISELRHPDDVFAPASLESLRNAPITIGHPQEDGALIWVSPDNADKYEVGVGSAGARDGDFVETQLSVRRADAIKRVDARDLCEISLGYDSTVVPESGVYQGKAYQQRQTGIVINHIALLAAGKGRLGDTAIRADSLDAVLDAEPMERRADEAGTQPERGRPMAKVTIDGIEVEIPDAAGAALVAKAVTEREAHKKRADAAEAAGELAKTDLAKARDPAHLQKAVKARVALEQSAIKVLGAEQRIDGLSDREVQEAVLKKARPEFKLEGRTDDAVSAAFDYALAGVAQRDEGLSLVRDGIDNPPPAKRGDQSELAKAAKEHEQARLDAWKPQRKGA
jgi:hypothetical protein